MNQLLKKSLYSAVSILIVAMFVLFCEHSASFTLDITLAGAIITIGLLATGLVMEYLAVLIFLAAMIILNIAPASVIFSGFISDAFWLTFASIPMGMAIKKTGLADRIAHLLVKFSKENYFFLVLGMTLFGVLMAFIMPSAMGRMILILPILIAFANANGFYAGTKGYNGLLLAGIFGTYIGGFAILPSNLPNIILMGSVSSLFHLNFNYAHYLLVNFPVLGVVKICLLTLVINHVFKENPSIKNTDHLTEIKQFSSHEKRLIFYLAVVLLVWFSDSITHLSPAWPAFVAAIVCLLPRVGVLDNKLFMKEINVEPLFYVGGLIGLSAVLNYTGLGSLLGEKLIRVMPFSASNYFVNYYLLSLTSTLIGLVTTLPGVPAIITPLSSSMSHMTHLPLMTVLMTQVVGFSNFILPYQAPPILVAMRLGNIALKDAAKLSLIMFVISMLILMPVNYLWWEFLKII